MDEAANAAGGLLGWTYTLDNAAAQYLAAGETVSETYIVTIGDGQGSTTTQEVVVTITGTADGPTAVADAASAGENEQKSLDVLANDLGTGVTLASLDTVTVISANGAVNAIDASTAFSIAAGQVAFDPGTLFDALDHDDVATVLIDYTVQDDHGASSSSTLTLTVVGANDAPDVAVVDVSGAVTELVAPVGFLTDSGTIAFSDADVADVHTLGPVTPSGGALGTLTVDLSTDTTGSGTGGVIAWDYSVEAAAAEYLGAGESRVETFSFDVSDGNGGTVARTVSVTLSGTNDVPVLLDDTMAASEDGSVSVGAGTLLLNDFDVDGDVLTISSLNVSGTAGAVKLDSGLVSYTAGSAFQHLQAGETASDAFGYTVSDGHGGTSSAIVHVTVEGANDAPTAGDDSAFVYAGSSIALNVLANDTDPEGDALALSTVSAPAHGSATLNANGTITYTPTAGYSGGDSFTYTVKDASGAQDSATVSLVVGFSDHDRIGGDVFLQGNYMEIGVSSAGSLGTANAAPSNYHPMEPGGSRISYVVDIDGWATGAAPTAGDFTLPGSPVDTIVLGVNGTSYVQDQRSGRQNIATTTTDLSAGSLLAAKTTGTAGGVQMTQLIELDAGATYYKTTITVQNVTGSTISDVRFLRSFDPDQDIYRYGTYNTFNDVLANPGGGSDIAVSRATGVVSGVSVNLIAFDASARASNYGFANYDAYSPFAWNNPQDMNGANVDAAITLEFMFGALAAGQQVSKVFYTSLNGNQTANDMSVGTPGADTLSPGLGNDLLLGLAGNDRLIGGGGNDRFVFSKGCAADIIQDFTAGASTDDVIELRGFGLTSLADVRARATQVGADLVIDLGGGDSIKLVGVTSGALHADDFQFA